MEILNKKIALLKSKVEKNETITIMIIGLGSVGTFLLDFLVSLRDPQLKIVVAGRNAAKMQMDVNIVRTAATIRRELRSQIEILGDCDLNDVDSIAATIKKANPDFIVNSTGDLVSAFHPLCEEHHGCLREGWLQCGDHQYLVFRRGDSLAQVRRQDVLRFR